MTAFPLAKLPPELIQRTASFLDPRNAIDLSRCCKSVNSNLRLSSLHPPLLLSSSQLVTRRSGITLTGDYAAGDEETPWLHLPIPFRRRVHSVTVVVRWRDQGWGNQKGQIRIVARRTTPRHPVDSDAPFHGGKSVAESPIAEHTTTECRLMFVPIQGRAYQLYYRVGGGGGHSLQFFSARVYTTVFDDEERYISNNYRMLHRAKALGPNLVGNTFYPELLVRASKSMRRQLAAGEEPDILLSFLLEEYSIPVNEPSLVALEEVLIDRKRLESGIVVDDDADEAGDY